MGSVVRHRSGLRVGMLVVLLAVSLIGVPQHSARATAPSVQAAGRVPVVGSVLAISVDGLRPGVIRALGRRGLPHLHRLMRQGASTLSARTAVEQTETLPNHSSIVTGRRIDPRLGGHGVTYNDDRPGTLHDAAGEQVASVFEVAAGAGDRPALFSSKSKFSLFQRSWPEAIDRFEMRLNNIALTSMISDDLLAQYRRFRFVHYSAPDVAGHLSGFNSAPYRDAVRRIDRQLGRLLVTITSRPRLARRLVLVLTSDHGGAGRGHYDPLDPRAYSIPFIVWGAGVAPAGDLYDLSPARRDPGETQPSYDGVVQPVRNGEVANLALDLLGLPAVPGSTLNAHQDLAVTP